MNKILEDLAKLIGRAWAQEWVERPQEQAHADKSTNVADDCEARMADAASDQNCHKSTLAVEVE